MNDYVLYYILYMTIGVLFCNLTKIFCLYRRAYKINPEHRFTLNDICRIINETNKEVSSEFEGMLGKTFFIFMKIVSLHLWWLECYYTLKYTK